MILSFRHVGIVVKEIKKSLFFYETLLGLKVQKELLETGDYIDDLLNLKKAKVKTVKLGFDNITLVELLQFQPEPHLSNTMQHLNETGITHFALTVKDLDHLYLKLSENNIKFNSPPQLSPDGYAKVVFCKDPDSNFIELVQVLSA